ncbi:hypothetical protein pipiens_008251, partial [Culex pipiens pipiens]
ELLKYSNALGENVTDLQKALELMLSVPSRAANNKYLESIEGFRGNLQKLGRVLAHEYFGVKDKENKIKERYLFLFKARILITKAKRLSDEKSIFILKDIVKLPDAQIKDIDSRAFELAPKTAGKGDSSAVVHLIAYSEEAKKRWIYEIEEYVNNAVALQEHANDDLRIDPTQTNIDESIIKLPQRIEAHKTDENIKPSDIADNYVVFKHKAHRDDAQLVQKTVSQEVVVAADEEEEEKSASVSERLAAFEVQKSRKLEFNSSKQEAKTQERRTSSSSTQVQQVTQQKQVVQTSTTQVQERRTSSTTQVQSSTVVQNSSVRQESKAVSQSKTQVQESKQIEAQTKVQSQESKSAAVKRQQEVQLEAQSKVQVVEASQQSVSKVESKTSSTQQKSVSKAQQQTIVETTTATAAAVQAQESVSKVAQIESKYASLKQKQHQQATTVSEEVKTESVQVVTSTKQDSVPSSPIDADSKIKQIESKYAALKQKQLEQKSDEVDAKFQIVETKFAALKQKQELQKQLQQPKQEVAKPVEQLSKVEQIESKYKKQEQQQEVVVARVQETVVQEQKQETPKPLSKLEQLESKYKSRQVQQETTEVIPTTPVVETKPAVAAEPLTPDSLSKIQLIESKYAALKQKQQQVQETQVTEVKATVEVQETQSKLAQIEARHTARRQSFQKDHEEEVTKSKQESKLPVPAKTEEKHFTAQKVEAVKLVEAQKKTEEASKPTPESPKPKVDKKDRPRLQIPVPEKPLDSVKAPESPKKVPESPKTPVKKPESPPPASKKLPEAPKTPVKVPESPKPVEKKVEPVKTPEPPKTPTKVPESPKPKLPETPKTPTKAPESPKPVEKKLPEAPKTPTKAPESPKPVEQKLPEVPKTPTKVPESPKPVEKKLPEAPKTPVKAPESPKAVEKKLPEAPKTPVKAPESPKPVEKKLPEVPKTPTKVPDSPKPVEKKVEPVKTPEPPKTPTKVPESPKPKLPETPKTPTKVPESPKPVEKKLPEAPQTPTKAPESPKPVEKKLPEAPKTPVKAPESPKAVEKKLPEAPKTPTKAPESPKPVEKKLPEEPKTPTKVPESPKPVEKKLPEAPKTPVKAPESPKAVEKKLPEAPKTPTKAPESPKPVEKKQEVSKVDPPKPKEPEKKPFEAKKVEAVKLPEPAKKVETPAAAVKAPESPKPKEVEKKPFEAKKVEAVKLPEPVKKVDTPTVKTPESPKPKEVEKKPFDAKKVEAVKLPELSKKSEPAKTKAESASTTGYDTPVADDGQEPSLESLVEQKSREESLKLKLDEIYAKEKAALVEAKRIRQTEEEEIRRKFDQRSKREIQQIKETALELLEQIQATRESVKTVLGDSDEPNKKESKLPKAEKLAVQSDSRLPKITKAADNGSDSQQQQESPPQESSNEGGSDQQEDTSGGDQSSQGNQGEDNREGSGDGSGGKRTPPPLRLPTFFDPPPPPVYQATIEVFIKKERPPPPPPPKITRKLVVNTDELERKTQLFFEGHIDVPDPDYSTAAAHRKVKGLKHLIGKTGETVRYAEDTVHKAEQGEFSSIVFPEPEEERKPREPAYEYQYTVEDPITGEKISQLEELADFEDKHLEKMSATQTEKLRVPTNIRPHFVQAIHGLCVEPGENAKFSCQLDERSSVQWLKDNKPLDDKLADRVITKEADNLTYSLEIQHCREEDTGTYTARAINGAENAACTAQLTVEKLTPEQRKALSETNAPVFSVILRNTEVVEKTYLTFLVKVKGDPKPKIRFCKDDREISDTDKRMKVVREREDSGYYELIIPEVHKGDCGVYSCTAYNKFGSTKTEAQLLVTDQRELFNELDTLDDKSKFVWKKNGVPFDPEERFKVLMADDSDSLALVFQHVKPEDAGLYTCVAATASGNIQCSAELTVQGQVNQLMQDPSKPHIVIESKDALSRIGGKAMLEMKVHGYPKPELVWRHEGTIIEPGGRFKFLYEDAESVSLVIMDVQSSDAGAYSIVAQNELGEDSTFINLTVKCPPSIVRPHDTSAMVGENFKMSVEVNAVPEATVRFYKNGKELKEDNRIKFLTAENYHIIKYSPTTMEDAGNYSIIAANEISQATEFWEFTINSPPRLMHGLSKETIVNEKEDIELYVKADSNPKPIVRWYKDGKEVFPDGKRILIIEEDNRYTLKIHAANRDDTALYTADIINDYGTVTERSQVNVNTKSKVREQLEAITCKEGDSNVVMSIKADGYPRPKVQWYIDDVEITESRNEFKTVEEGLYYKLIMKEAKAELQGVYKAKFTNEYGSDESSAKTTIQCSPKVRKSLVDTEVDENTTLTLEVEIYAEPVPEISWFKNGQPVQTDARLTIKRDSQRVENYTLSLTMVRGADSGDYEVRAVNAMGTATSKSRVVVQTVYVEQEAIVEESNEELLISDTVTIEQTVIELVPEVPPKEDSPVREQTSVTIEVRKELVTEIAVAEPVAAEEPPPIPVPVQEIEIVLRSTEPAVEEEVVLVLDDQGKRNSFNNLYTIQAPSSLYDRNL